MPAPSSWGKTPRRSIEEECARRGRPAVVAGCVALLSGRDADPELVTALGGPPARRVLTQSAGPDYWLRVWAARGLLWAWDDTAVAALTLALTDEHWRVREMALKVVARHRVDEALEPAAELQRDPVPRVRAAAGRALTRLASAGDRGA